MKAFAAFVVDKKKYVLVLYVLLIAAGIVGLFYTNVNYDMSKYLPSDSSVKEGMAVMDEEFGSLSSITVMFTGLDESERQTVRQALAQVENVKSVAYTAGDDAYDRGENAKYVLTIGAGTYTDEAREVLRTLRTQFSDYDVSYSGAVADNDLLITTLTEEIPVIVLIAAVVILLILFCLCESWLEPLLFVGCIGIAVVLNMGSNAFLPSVSFMTLAVGALLQVGLSMDYSIMLMNRYALERQSEPDPASAMKKALAGAFGAITSSSVTTIVGLLALLFMSFAIGRDMGIVLAKGVLISLLCIFTALPGMIVKLDGPLRRTQKKALHFPTAPLMRFVARARFILIPAVAAVVVGAFFLKDGVPVNYIKMFDNPDQEKIEAVFGLENQTVVLYDKNTPDEAVRSFIEALEAREDVRSVEDYSNTVGLPLTYSELAAGFGMEPALAQTVYRLYADRMNTEPLGSLTVYEYLQFIAQLAEDDAFAPLIGGNADMLSAMLAALESGKAELDAAIEELDRSEAEMEAAQAQLDAMIEQLKAAGMTDEQIAAQTAEAAAALEQGRLQLAAGREALESSEGYQTIYVPMDAQSLAALTQQNAAQVELVLRLRRSMQLDVESLRLSIDECLAYLTGDLLAQDGFSALLDEDMRALLQAGVQELEAGKAMLLGERYNRMVVTAAVPGEGAETFALIGDIESLAEEKLTQTAYLVGDAAMGYEMDSGFDDEMNLVTLLTIAAIFLIVLITFRTVVGSAALVAIIQGAVFITTAVVALTGAEVNYIALILVQCILMGATIDYGILFISQYREARADADRIDALCIAMDRSLRTILTSSFILMGCCLSVAVFMTQRVISQTCYIIAGGALCSVLLTIFLLPAVTLLLDRFLVRGKRS